MASDSQLLSRILIELGNINRSILELTREVKKQGKRELPQVYGGQGGAGGISFAASGCSCGGGCGGQGNV